MKAVVISLAALLFASPNYQAFDDDALIVEPKANFTINFCNFPHAWTVSRGKGVTIGAVYSDEEEHPDWLTLIQSRAPEAETIQLSMEDFLGPGTQSTNCQVITLFESFGSERFPDVTEAIKRYADKGITVVMPAYFGILEAGKDYSQWKAFVKRASEVGALIVGTHGNMYQIGDISFWKDMPIDVFALDSRIGGDRYFMPDSALPVTMEVSSISAAGAAALLKSKYQDLSPSDVRKTIREKCLPMVWSSVSIEWKKEDPWKRTWPYTSIAMRDNKLQAQSEYNPQVFETLSSSALDTALLFDIDAGSDGRWALECLRSAEAQKIATGKGVTVAILDHMFDPEDPSLKGRTVHPGSVIEDAPVFDPKIDSGHGTWMATDLVSVAPDVKIMPVRIVGQKMTSIVDSYTAGIDYAVENGADVISLSHQPVQKDDYPKLDAAIERASKAGVTFVYIHYYGDRNDVVLTGPIEFAKSDEGLKRVYVIGTNSRDEGSFPYTWGFSKTAPLVAGVVAMLKELEPSMSPMEIKEILLKSGRTVDGEYQVLDAVKALEQVK